MKNVALGLGSNLGEREKNLLKAISIIQANDFIEIEAKSSFYDTKAVLPDNSKKDWDINYLNSVIKVKTIYSPEQLLDQCKEIEIAMGRKKSERWAPRIIDIDIIAFEDLVYENDLIIIPHKEMLNRDFVLKPFIEIWPDWIFPKQGKFFGQKICDITSSLGY